MRGAMRRPTDRVGCRPDDGEPAFDRHDVPLRSRSAARALTAVAVLLACLAAAAPAALAAAASGALTGVVAISKPQAVPVAVFPRPPMAATATGPPPTPPRTAAALHPVSCATAPTSSTRSGACCA